MAASRDGRRRRRLETGKFFECPIRLRARRGEATRAPTIFQVPRFILRTGPETTVPVQSPPPTFFSSVPLVLALIPSVGLVYGTKGSVKREPETAIERRLGVPRKFRRIRATDRFRWPRSPRGVRRRRFIS